MSTRAARRRQTRAYGKVERSLKTGHGIELDPETGLFEDPVTGRKERRQFERQQRKRQNAERAAFIERQARLAERAKRLGLLDDSILDQPTDLDIAAAANDDQGTPTRVLRSGRAIGKTRAAAGASA